MGDLKVHFREKKKNDHLQGIASAYFDIWSTIKDAKMFQPIEGNELKNHEVKSLRFETNQKVLFLDMDETLIHTEVQKNSIMKNQNEINQFNMKSISKKYLNFDNTIVIF